MEAPFTPLSNPHERASDRGLWSAFKHNAHWVWLIIITGLVLFSLISIQQSRYDQCVSQNKRHDSSVTALRQGSDQDIANAPTAAAKIEIARRRDVTISLLDALAPVQNCDETVGSWFT